MDRKKQRRKVCPKCGKIGKITHEYCRHCGSSLVDTDLEIKSENEYSEIIICPSCGEQNKIGSNFCDGCGYNFEDVTTQKTILARGGIYRTSSSTGQQPPPVTESTEKSRKKDHPVLNVCLGFLQLCEGCLSIFTCCAACT